MRQTLGLGAGAAGAVAACMLVPASGMRSAGHPLVVVALVAAIILFVAIGREAWRHQRLAASMSRLGRPAMIEGTSVALVPGLGAALVAGLRRPQIYCADDLCERLDSEELRAVILHEHHHQLSRGPAQLVLISALAPILGRIEPGQAWMERERAKVEIAADAYALSAGASRQALASALLKLAASPGLSAAPGFSSAVDLRVRALLGQATGIERGGSGGQIAAALVLIASCVALYLR